MVLLLQLAACVIFDIDSSLLWTISEISSCLKGLGLALPRFDYLWLIVYIPRVVGNPRKKHYRVC